MGQTLTIPLPTLKRYSFYLTHLAKHEYGEWVSTSFLSDATGIKPITIRKDLSYLGIKGIPQKGFPWNTLVEKLKGILGGDSFNDLILVGSWGLGSAYIKTPELIPENYKLRVCFDNNPGFHDGQIPVYPMERLKDLIERLGVSIALLSVDPKDLQKTAEELYEKGIKAILNLTNRSVKKIEGCIVVDFNPLTPISEVIGMLNR